MRVFLIGLLAASVVHYVAAQKSPIKFGEIPLEDMKMTVYAEDSSAAAVILEDYGHAFLRITSTQPTLNFERHVRIKILKKEGTSWADASIPLYHVGNTEEKISGLKAVTYNLENGVIKESKMSKDAVYNEKFNRFFNLHKFTLPNVREGSVIEYSYTIMSEFITNFPDWQFQYSIPTRHSEYWAVIPDFFIYQKYMQGYASITSYEVKSRTMGDYQTQAHHWVSKNVPAFREEPYMTCEEDYLTKINFALSHISFPSQPVQDIMGSWEKLNSNLLESESFGDIIKGSGFLKKHVEEITAGMTDPEAKAKAIYHYVKNTLEWDGTKDFGADNLKKVFDLKKGTSGDINLALASMLEKAGLKVDMVLLSTRDHGFIRQEYPMREQFNYVICALYLNDKVLLLDATEKLLPMNTLPDRCLNGKGLIISRINKGWIDLESEAKAKTIIFAEFTLGEDGVLSGNLNFTHDGYDAHKMRKDYFSKGQETYVKELFSGKPWEIKKSEYQNTKEIELPAKQLHHVTINEHVAVAGEAMYINPFVMAQLSENPFKLEKREYPVDFGSIMEKLYLCKIAIPAGYTVEELPKSRVLMLPDNAAKYVYNVAQAGAYLNIASTLQVNKSLFVQDEYPVLREFYNQIVAKQAEQIVLKKKQ